MCSTFHTLLNIDPHYCLSLERYSIIYKPGLCLLFHPTLLSATTTLIRDSLQPKSSPAHSISPPPPKFPITWAMNAQFRVMDSFISRVRDSKYHSGKCL